VTWNERTLTSTAAEVLGAMQRRSQMTNRYTCRCLSIITALSHQSPNLLRAVSTSNLFHKLSATSHWVFVRALWL